MLTRDTETMQKPEIFAKSTVKAILASSPSREVYKGTMASISWALESYGPKWVYVRPKPYLVALLLHR